MGCLRTLSTRGDVNTESLAAPSDSNWSVRFQETGDPFAELAHADFDRGHGDAPHPECTLMCTHSQACQDSRDSCSGSVPWSRRDRKSTRLNSSHEWISYAVFCLKKK